MSPEQRRTVPDTDELLRLLGQAARDGKVTAIRELLAEHRRAQRPGPPRDSLSVFDEIAERRRAAMRAG